MKRLKKGVPFLGLFALIALFLKMPEMAKALGTFGCRSCLSSDPYLTLAAAGYFAFLTALSFLFTNFPDPPLAKGGLVWSILLALGLTYLNLPEWCGICLFCHACNIAMWSIWAAEPNLESQLSQTGIKERMFLVLYAPISVVVLFSCLNLTFIAYGFKLQKGLGPGFQPGDTAPAFAATTTASIPVSEVDSRYVIGFVAANCPFCKEQLPIVNSVSLRNAGSAYRFLAVTPRLTRDLIEQAPELEWIEDKEGALRSLFKVSGYPTLFIVDSKRKIAQVIPGVPERLEALIMDELTLDPSR